MYLLLILWLGGLQTFGACAAQSVMKQGHFRKIGGDNVALQGFVLEQTQVGSRFLCGGKCLDENLCFSFNFKKTKSSGGHDCMLNFETTDGSGASLQSQEGFTYYEVVNDTLASSSPGVTAAGFDRGREDFFMVYQSYILLYASYTGEEGVPPTNYFDSQGLTIHGMRVTEGTPAGTIEMHIYTDTGDVYHFNITVSPKTVVSTNLGTLKQVHGSMAPIHVDDVITLGATVYLIEGNMAYILDGADQVISSFDSRDPSSPFRYAPRPITAGTNIQNNDIFYAKGMRYYRYSTASHEITYSNYILAS